MTAQAQIDRHRWFHAIDFGDGVASPGRFGRDVPPNYTLYGVFDLLRRLRLDGARCLDVGTMDGLAAFVMKRLGAREVVACDLARRPTFELARDLLGLDIDYRTPVDAAELPELFGDESADLIVMAGVLYHVFDPVRLLLACRRALRRGGFLLLETTYLYDSAQPVMSFNPIDRSARRIDNPHVYWRPTKATVHGVLQLAGFSIVATVAVDARLAVLAEARRPSEIQDRSDLLVATQDAHRHPHYTDATAFDRLEAAGEASSGAIAYDGPNDDRFLYRALYQPNVPYQPRWQPSSRAVWAADLARSFRMHTRAHAAELRPRAAALLDRLRSRGRVA